MPLIINGNFENGALFYYFWLRRFFSWVPGQDWEAKRKWGKTEVEGNERAVERDCFVARFRGTPRNDVLL
jgi:hypothetical protein